MAELGGDHAEVCWVIPTELGSTYLVGPEPARPPSTGGPLTWEDPENTKPLRGMKSNAKRVLCVGGPFHRWKLARAAKIGNGKDAKRVPLCDGQTFTVKPWHGRYEYDDEKDRYEWIDGN